MFKAIVRFIKKLLGCEDTVTPERDVQPIVTQPVVKKPKTEAAQPIEPTPDDTVTPLPVDESQPVGKSFKGRSSSRKRNPNVVEK